jgi:hypothetical protein
MGHAQQRSPQQRSVGLGRGGVDRLDLTLRITLLAVGFVCALFRLFVATMAPRTVSSGGSLLPVLAPLLLLLASVVLATNAAPPGAYRDLYGNVKCGGSPTSSKSLAVGGCELVMAPHPNAGSWMSTFCTATGVVQYFFTAPGCNVTQAYQATQMDQNQCHSGQAPFEGDTAFRVSPFMLRCDAAAVDNPALPTGPVFPPPSWIRSSECRVPGGNVYADVLKCAPAAQSYCTVRAFNPAVCVPRGISEIAGPVSKLKTPNTSQRAYGSPDNKYVGFAVFAGPTCATTTFARMILNVTGRQSKHAAARSHASAPTDLFSLSRCGSLSHRVVLVVCLTLSPLSRVSSRRAVLRGCLR